MENVVAFCDNSLRSLLNFRGDVLAHFLSLGKKVYAVVPRSTVSDELVALIPSGVELLCTDLIPDRVSPLRDAKATWQMICIYRKIRPDMVFNYTIKPNIYSSIAARCCGIKCISMVAGLGYSFSGHNFTRRMGRTLYRIGLGLSHRVLTLNQSNYDLLIRRRYVSRKRCVLLKGGEGVNLKRFPLVENSFEHGVRFLMVARVLYDKGYAEFAEAGRIIRQRHPEVNVELLGPMANDRVYGVPQSVLDADVADGKLTYLGETTNVPQFVGRPGVVVVVNSYHEGLNRALMEACAMGRPCITTDIPGCREIVRDGENGYLVPVKDANALADAMERFLKLSEAEKQQMCAASYRHAVADFDVDSVLGVYDRLMSE